MAVRAKVIRKTAPDGADVRSRAAALLATGDAIVEGLPAGQERDNAAARLRECVYWLVAAVSVWLCMVGPASAQTPRDALNRHDALLECGGTTDGDTLWECTGAFTMAVACDLAADYSPIRKAAGRQCDGWDCDKLIARVAPYRIFDIVGGGGAKGQRAVWDDTGHFAKASDLVDRSALPCGGAPPAPGGGTGPAPTPPAPVNLAPVLEALAALRADVAALAGVVGDIRAAAQSAEHDAREINASRMAGELVNLTPLLEALAPLAAGWPEYSGRVFGTGVTLRPRAGGQ